MGIARIQKETTLRQIQTLLLAVVAGMVFEISGVKP